MRLPIGEEMVDCPLFVTLGRSPEPQGRLEREVMVAREGRQLRRSLHRREFPA
jgi:hypothetical protein